MGRSGRSGYTTAATGHNVNPIATGSSACPGSGTSRRSHIWTRHIRRRIRIRIQTTLHTSPKLGLGDDKHNHILLQAHGWHSFSQHLHNRHLGILHFATRSDGSLWTSRELLLLAAAAEERNMLSEVEASYVRNLTSSQSQNVPVERGPRR